MTIHAEEEMNFDDFTIFDVENAILTGAILKRQMDSETREFKYVNRRFGTDGSRCRRRCEVESDEQVGYHHSI